MSSNVRLRETPPRDNMKKLVDDEVDDRRICIAIRTTLNRQEGGSMKLKHLIKQVVLLIDDSSSGNKKALKQWIKRRSDMFVIHENGSSKMISLKPAKRCDYSNDEHDTKINSAGGEDAVETINENDTAQYLPQDDDDDAGTNNNSISISNRNSKRKRKHSTATSGGDTTNTDITSPTTNTLNNRRSSMLFHGLTIAISTLESKQDNEVDDKGTTLSSNDDFYNYKTLKHTLQSHGATIASQVHKRVHYLIVTNTAVQYLTQRVRQAYKRNVTIVHVSWVQECITMGKIVDITNSKHLCNDEVACLVNEKIDNKTGNNNIAQVAAAVVSKKKKATMMSSPITDNTTTGWSTPILLDCCCACHDVNDGDDDDNNNCPWCVKKYGANVDCNIIMLKNQKEGNEQKKYCVV